MDVRHIKCFIALAHELHFGHAAQRLHVTQPALSFSIRQLEESLGLRLFERDSKSVRLTSAGRALLANAEGLMLQLNRTIELGKALAGGLAGRIEVGFVGTMLYRGFGRMVTGFWRSYPMIELKLREMNSHDQLELLASGELDAAFINDCAAPAGFDAIAVAHERFLACVPASSRLGRKKAVVLQDLADDPFVMFTRGASQPYYDYIMDLCNTAGFVPKRKVEASQLTSVAAFVAAGAGVAILPEAICQMRLRGAKFLPIEGVEAVPCAYFVWNSSRMPPGLDAFVASIRNATGPAT